MSGTLVGFQHGINVGVADSRELFNQSNARVREDSEIRQSLCNQQWRVERAVARFNGLVVDQQLRAFKEVRCNKAVNVVLRQKYGWNSGDKLVRYLRQAGGFSYLLKYLAISTVDRIEIKIRDNCLDAMGSQRAKTQTGNSRRYTFSVGCVGVRRECLKDGALFKYL